jgi:hypothetical protein
MRPARGARRPRWQPGIGLREVIPGLRQLRLPREDRVVVPRLPLDERVDPEDGRDTVPLDGRLDGGDETRDGAEPRDGALDRDGATDREDEFPDVRDRTDEGWDRVEDDLVRVPTDERVLGAVDRVPTDERVEDRVDERVPTDERVLGAVDRVPTDERVEDRVDERVPTDERVPGAVDRVPTDERVEDRVEDRVPTEERVLGAVDRVPTDERVEDRVEDRVPTEERVLGAVDRVPTDERVEDRVEDRVPADERVEVVPRVVEVVPREVEPNALRDVPDRVPDCSVPRVVRVASDDFGAVDVVPRTTFRVPKPEGSPVDSVERPPRVTPVVPRVSRPSEASAVRPIVEPRGAQVPRVGAWAITPPDHHGL